jgi:hypothetical protein
LAGRVLVPVLSLPQAVHLQLHCHPSDWIAVVSHSLHWRQQQKTPAAVRRPWRRQQQLLLVLLVVLAPLHCCLPAVLPVLLAVLGTACVGLGIHRVLL